MGTAGGSDKSKLFLPTDRLHHVRWCDCPQETSPPMENSEIRGGRKLENPEAMKSEAWNRKGFLKSAGKDG